MARRTVTAVRRFQSHPHPFDRVLREELDALDVRCVENLPTNQPAETAKQTAVPVTQVSQAVAAEEQITAVEPDLARQRPVWRISRRGHVEREQQRGLFPQGPELQDDF